MHADLNVLEKRLGLKFKSLVLLEQALTHRSYLNENRHCKHGHNERMEFLGDAIIEAIISEFLYISFPNKEEGELTQMRGAVVNGVAMEKLARELGLNDFILLSRGEAKDLKSRGRILANTMESLTGAIFLDLGREAAHAFVAKLFFPLVRSLASLELRDAKSILQEKVQALVGHTPRYKTISESGPDHEKKFVVGVYASEQMLAKGEGLSKIKAEQVAAERALAKM